MNLEDKQREKLLELKKFSQQNKQTYTKIVKNLLKIKNQIFEELNKTNSMVNSIRNSLSDVQIAKFLFWVKSVSNIKDASQFWSNILI